MFISGMDVVINRVQNGCVLMSVFLLDVVSVRFQNGCV